MDTSVFLAFWSMLIMSLGGAAAIVVFGMIVLILYRMLSRVATATLEESVEANRTVQAIESKGKSGQ